VGRAFISTACAAGLIRCDFILGQEKYPQTIIKLQLDFLDFQPINDIVERNIHI